MTLLEKIVEQLDRASENLLVFYSVVEDESRDLSIYIPKTEKLIFNRRILPFLEQKEESDDCFVLNPLSFGNIEFVVFPDLEGFEIPNRYNPKGFYCIELESEVEQIRNQIKRLLDLMYYKNNVFEYKLKIGAYTIFKKDLPTFSKDEFPLNLDYEDCVFVDHKFSQITEGVRKLNKKAIYIFTRISSANSNTRLEFDAILDFRYKEFRADLVFYMTLGEVRIKDIGRLI